MVLVVIFSSFVHIVRTWTVYGVVCFQITTYLDPEEMLFTVQWRIIGIAVGVSVGLVIFFVAALIMYKVCYLIRTVYIS